MKRLTKYLGALLLGGGLGLGALGLAHVDAGAAATPAKSTEEFVNSIGVNIHTHYWDTPYGRNAKLIEAVKNLGVKHLRDAAHGTPKKKDGTYDENYENYNKAVYGQHRQIYDASGATFNLIVDPRSPGLADPTSTELEEQIDKIRNYAGPTLESFEGPNEYELSGDPNWVEKIHSYQAALYQAVKAGGNEPVAGPSHTYREAYQKIGDMSAYVDKATFHAYDGGRHPGTGPYGPNGYGTLAWQMQTVRYQSASDPIWATESGYTNAIQHPSAVPVPEEVSGDYIPRKFLEHFKAGIERTYAYELVDLNTANPAGFESNFGLVHSDYTPKPAYTTLKNMISIVHGQNANVNPGSLDYTFMGSTDGLHHLLLQDANRNFYVIFWLEKSQYDVNTKQAIDVPKQSLTLKTMRRNKRMSLYMPKGSAGIVKTIKNRNQIKVAADTDPRVVKISR
jgi:hypothetical protein